MANEVEIVVVSKDKTNFGPIQSKAKSAGEDSGKAFGDGFTRDSRGRLHDGLGRFVAEGAKTGLTAGLKTGASFGTAFTGSLTKMGPAGVAVIAGIGVAAAPILSATIAGAVIGGAGLGGIIGGIMLVKDDPRVQAVGQVVGQRMFSNMKLRAEPIVAPLISAMRTVDTAIQRNGDKFGRIFQNASRWIQPLADTLSSVVDDFSSGMESLTDNAEPVMQALVEGAELFGDALRISMEQLSQVGPEGALAIKTALMGAAVVLVGISATVSALAKVFGFLARTGVFGPGMQMEIAKFDAQLQQAKDSINGVTVEANEATGALTGLSDALKAQTDPAFALIEAQNGLKDAQNNYTEAVKKHGKGSREAADAEMELARAALRMQGAAEQAGAAFNGAMTPALRATLRAAGLSEDAIRGVERQMRSAAQAGKAFGRGYVASIKLTGLGGVQGAAGAARRAIASIPSTKVITIYSRVVGGNIFGAGYVGRASGGIVGNYATAATGGPRSNMVLVGEQGPELVDMAPGSKVIPNGKTQSMMSGGGNVPREIKITFDFVGMASNGFADFFNREVRAGRIRVTPASVY